MATHDYLSTACWQEANDGKPDLHGSCRAVCKFGGVPEFCRCPNHAEGEKPSVSNVDQARGVARRMLDHLTTLGADFEALDVEFARALREDPALFWLRGEVQPDGVWREPGSEETT